MAFCSRPRCKHGSSWFEHDLEELRRSLADRFDDETYPGMDKYDLAAVYHDWDSEAIERLRSLCEEFGAGIVISSDWRRSKSTRQLQALFRMHELHHRLEADDAQRARQMARGRHRSGGDGGRAQGAGRDSAPTGSGPAARAETSRRPDRRVVRAHRRRHLRPAVPPARVGPPLRLGGLPLMRPLAQLAHRPRPHAHGAPAVLRRHAVR